MAPARADGATSQPDPPRTPLLLTLLSRVSANGFKGGENRTIRAHLMVVAHLMVAPYAEGALRLRAPISSPTLTVTTPATMSAAPIHCAPEGTIESSTMVQRIPNSGSE